MESWLSTNLLLGVNVGKITDRKGNIGVGMVCANLISNGIDVLIPITEHLPFDLIAYSKGNLYKIQVKYSSLVNGCVIVPLGSVLMKNGKYQHVRYKQNDINIYAVYCNNNKQVYYIAANNVKNLNKEIRLRINPPKHRREQKTIRWANDYNDIQKAMESCSSMVEEAGLLNHAV